LAEGQWPHRWLRRMEASPFVTKHESLRGFIFDVATGNLYEVGRQHDRSNGQVSSSV
jgi:hypothetical protein